MKKRYTFATGMLALVLIIAACSNPFAIRDGDQSALGQLRLSFGFGSSRTITPLDEDVIESIVMYAVRLRSAGQVDVTAIGSSGMTIENLAPGFWNVTVQALNGEGAVVATGSSDEDVEVTAGPNASCELTLSCDPANGYGDVAISVQYPASPGVDSVSASLLWGAFTPTAVRITDLGDGVNQVDISAARVKAGALLLSVAFEKDGVTLATMTEVVWVFRNLITTGLRVLSEDDFGAVPTAPANLTMTTAGGGSDVFLYWTPTSLIAEGYVLECSAGADGPWVELLSETDPYLAWYTHDEAQPGQAYRYRVAAVNRFGRSDYATGSVTATPLGVLRLGTLITGVGPRSYYWTVDGIPHDLESVGVGVQLGNSLAVNGEDVYVAGAYLGFDEYMHPALWKNGESMAIAQHIMVNEIPSDIALMGSNVYVSGNRDDLDDSYPLYWKNGSMFLLPSGGGGNSFECGDICIDGSDVYIAGLATHPSYGSYPVFWKNGALVKLSNPEDVAGYYSGLPLIPRMAVSNGTVYLAGAINSQPVYWRIDGGLSDTSVHYLSTGYSTSGWVDGVAVSNGDVYFAGTVGGASYARPVYWKNQGDPCPLRVDQPANDVIITDIVVQGGDIYICGSIVLTSTLNQVHTVWKNGWISCLEAEDGDGQALALALPSAAEPVSTGTQGGFYVDGDDFLADFKIMEMTEVCGPGDRITIVTNVDELSGSSMLYLDGAESTVFDTTNGTILFDAPGSATVGYHTITVTDTIGGAVYSDGEQFFCELALSGLSPTYASGQGISFTVNLDPAITCDEIDLDGDPIAGWTEEGGVVNLTLPPLLQGYSYTITVWAFTDGESVQAEWTFEVPAM